MFVGENFKREKFIASFQIWWKYLNFFFEEKHHMGQIPGYWRGEKGPRLGPFSKKRGRQNKLVLGPKLPKGAGALGAPKIFWKN